jgi:hypothetical protein
MTFSANARSPGLRARTADVEAARSSGDEELGPVGNALPTASTLSPQSPYWIGHRHRGGTAVCA